MQTNKLNCACFLELCAQASFGRSHAVSPPIYKSWGFDLLSASILVNMFNTLTGFTYRRHAPHNFTPMPVLHSLLHSDTHPPSGC